MTQETILKRLSIIKSVYNSAVNQAEKPEITSFTALLSFHDSIDMFMNLAAEHRNIANRRSLFLMDHYNFMTDLTLQSSVKKINDRRNNLKHNGQIPAKIEIDESKTTATTFFKDNTPIVFGFDFDTVSLAQLVANQNVRDFIIAAEGFYDKGNYKEAIISVAKAYGMLEEIHSLDLSKEGSHNFWERGYVSSLPKATSQGEWFIQSPFDENNRLKIDETLLALNQIYRQNFLFIFSALQNMTLGVDYRDIVRFKRIVPSVVAETPEGELITSPIVNEEQLTQEKAAFAIQFVIDFAFKVQAQ